jgi:hypothetical protein
MCKEKKIGIEDKLKHDNFFTLKLKNFAIESKIRMKFNNKRKYNVKVRKKPKHKPRQTNVCVQLQ